MKLKRVYRTGRPQSGDAVKPGPVIAKFICTTNRVEFSEKEQELEKRCTVADAEGFQERTIKKNT